MATITAFDNINRLERRKEYRNYFKVMEIPERRKRKRERLAEFIDDEWIIFMMLLLAMKTTVDFNRAADEHIARLRKGLEENGVSKGVIEDYIYSVAEPEIAVTRERMDDDEYWLSPERALNIAENDANILMHGQEFQDAVAEGKRFHQWLTMKDERVRPTHVAVDDEVLPINEPFVVGGSLLMYPGDTSLGADPSEIVNCRCAVTYL